MAESFAQYMDTMRVHPETGLPIKTLHVNFTKQTAKVTLGCAPTEPMAKEASRFVRELIRVEELLVHQFLCKPAYRVIIKGAEINCIPALFQPDTKAKHLAKPEEMKHHEQLGCLVDSFVFDFPARRATFYIGCPPNDAHRAEFFAYCHQISTIHAVTLTQYVGGAKYLVSKTYENDYLNQTISERRKKAPIEIV